MAATKAGQLPRNSVRLIGSLIAVNDEITFQLPRELTNGASYDLVVQFVANGTVTSAAVSYEMALNGVDFVLDNVFSGWNPDVVAKKLQNAWTAGLGGATIRLKLTAVVFGTATKYDVYAQAGN